MLGKKLNLNRYLICLFGLILLFSVQTSSFAQDKIEKIDALIQKYVDYGQFNGTALVAEKGKVIFKKGYSLANREWNIPNQPNTKFRLGSITKQFTSMLILQLVESGKINLQGKLYDYLPYYRKDTGYDHHDTIIPNRATGYNKTFDGYLNSPYMDMSLPYAAGSLYSTVQDLHTWDQALYTEKLLPERLKELLFKNHISNYGYGWGVRYKKLPDSEQKLRSISHGGGIKGFNTLIERLVDDRHLIVLLNNTPGANLGRMSDAIIRVLYDKPYTLPKRSIADAIYKTLKEKDIQTALKQYETFKKDKPKEYDFSAAELNNLGYYLLINKKNNKDAIEIFKFNIKIFPNYANGYDSLGEAYMMAENTRKAIKNFAKSLELNPNNTNAIYKLNELIKKK